MADYRLTQSGEEVQELLNQVTPNQQAIRGLQNDKVDKVEGKGLSDENFTANEKNKLGDLPTESDLNTELGKKATIVSLGEETQARQQGDAALNQFIQQVQASLINYYLKTETYSANQIDAMLAAIKQFRYQVVDVLPTPSADTMGIIYLVPSAHAVSGNIKDEYITLTRDEGAGIIYYFEQIGETAIDLSNYYTKAQTNAEITAAINAALAAYYTSTQTDAAIAAAIATAIANYYTKSQVDALIANFITASVNNLVNYYLKSETFTKAEVNQLIAAVQQFTYQSVTTLPTASADTMNKIYLVPSTNPQTKNVKDEYITIATTDQGTTTYSWEQIGTTTVDLSGYSTTEQMNAAIANAIATALANYYTKSQTMTSAEIEAAISAALLTYSTTSEMNTAITAAINSALASYSTTSEMNTAIATAIANYYTKAEVDALIANFITKSVNDLVNYYLKSDTYTKTEVQQLIDAVKQFTYVSVAELPTASADTVNKIYLVPSTNPKTKNVKDEFITISVTDQGTTTYSWEQIGTTTVDLSGYSTTEQMNAAIANAIATALANYYTKAQTMTSEEIAATIGAALQSYSTTEQMNAAISAALNAALASYSTTEQMNAAIATAIANYYTKAQVDALIADFITASVNNLVNYYLKSETFTKAEVNQLIAAVKQFQYQSVAELPTASAQTMNIIYLVPGVSPTTQNVKDEYITIATTNEMQETVYAWEKIGTTEIDLSNYYTKAQTDAAITAALNAALTDYSTTQQMTVAIAAALASYYTKSEVDALIADFITASVNNLVNYYLKSETFTKAEVNQLIAAVKQFQYQSVAELPTASAQTMNIIYLVPGVSPTTQNVKDEYITIATTNEMQETVYSWEKIGTTEIDLSNYYTKTQTDAAITAALNAALADYSTTQQMTAAISQALAAYYTKTEVDALIANFITASTQNLVYYYLKSETYSASEVDQLLAAVKQFTYEAVAVLPTASAQTVGKIYLVPNADPQQGNVKDEYITLTTTEESTTTYSWECIGSTTIDLSNYYTKAQTDAAITAALNAALANYLTSSQTSTLVSTAITTALASYYNKTEIDTQMAGKQATLTFDNTPTENSNNPVKSGGVYAANASLYDTLHGEVQTVNHRIDTLFNADYVGFSVRLSDTTKVMNMIGTAEQLAAFDDWVDNSPKPCEVKKDGTDFAYLTNTAGVASSTSWLTRADGTPSKYSTQDKNYLQMVELENVNISIETTGTQLRVMFNFSPVCPEGFHRMFAEPTKLMSRYDLTFNSDGLTLDCCNGTSQPSGTFSFDNIHSMLDASGLDLLNWTAWEIACLGWIQAMRFRTLDVPSSARGKGLQSGSETAARGWVNGTTDSLTTPHGGVDQNGNGGYRFMYMENCTDGKQWLMGFGWHGNNGKGYFTRDDYKANAQALIPILECEAEHDYPTNLSETYAKNVSELGIATEGGGSTSSGFFDGNWSSTSDDRIFYAGGGSGNGAICGPFARYVITDAAPARWDLRGRVALRKSEVSA